MSKPRIIPSNIALVHTAEGRLADCDASLCACLEGPGGGEECPNPASFPPTSLSFTVPLTSLGALVGSDVGGGGGKRVANLRQCAFCADL
jgi:hypothetical protein